jgi:hypothetical protein
VTTAPGYSGTPLHRKLGVRAGSRVLVRDAPRGWDPGLLGADGAACVHVRATRTPYDVVLVFCPDAATMSARLPVAMDRTATAGRCWVAWPKKASKVPTDLTEDVVRAAALRVGWVDVKVCAVDDVRRKENRGPGAGRPRPAPPTPSPRTTRASSWPSTTSRSGSAR